MSSYYVEYQSSTFQDTIRMEYMCDSLDNNGQYMSEFDWLDAPQKIP